MRQGPKIQQCIVAGALLTTLGLFAQPVPTASAAAPADESAGARPSRSARFVRVPGYNVTLKLWEGVCADGDIVPWYAISQNGQAFSAPQATSYELKLRHGNFDPLGAMPAPEIEDGFAAGEDTNLYIVQFVTQTLEEYRAVVSDLGGDVYFFLANHSQIVRMDPAVRDEVAALPFVRWVGPYHPAYRLEEYYLHNAAQGAALFPLQKYNIMVLESGMRQKSIVARRILELGGIVDREHAGKYLLEATLTPEQLFEVVRWDEVLFVDHWSPGETDMDIGRDIGGADYIEAEAGFDGTGVRGEVLDVGFNLSHVDFADHPLIEHTPVGGDSHGAATSGIVFGDGTGNPMGRGLLPEGQGIVAAWSAVSIGEPRYDHTGELVQAPYFAVLQTASVGSDRTTQYTTISADTDAMLFDFDITHCQSQSNAGDQMSRPQAWAKNIVSGGAANHYDTATRDDDCWCFGASIGPATDGRIKPDLCFFYDNIFTVSSGSSTAYTPSFGGTSGATPMICGSIGLIYQMWSDGIFGNEVDPFGSVFDNRCHMTTAKALAINSATQYPFTGTSHDLTRTHQGWGMPDLRTLYDLRDKMLIVDETDILQNMQSVAYVVSITSGAPAFKATMTYADPPGVPGASQHRINDLTLKVISPSGTVYWGNNGLLSGNWSTSGGLPNVVDTVENVFVENPEPGPWTVEVIASEINEDSHVETPALDADFALVVSGGELGPGFSLSADPSTQDICAPADAIYTINIEQFVGFEQPVTLSAIGAPAGTTVTFADNPVIPPSVTTMTISGTGGAPLGDYNIEILGDAPDMDRSIFVGLGIFDDIPAAPTLLSPPHGSSDVSIVPTLEWGSAGQASVYHLEVATDIAFTDVVYAADTDETSHTLSTALETTTIYYWRVAASNTCGDGAFSEPFSFLTQDVPSVLLVDDDDNSPNVRDYYTDALDALGIWYDVWDTNNSDNEPSASELAPYSTVIWFTGDEFGGSCGPGGAGEAALSTWLDNGGCLFISSQDYLYDRGQTGFMTNYLGMSSGDSDVTQTSVTGQGSVFGGMGTFGLSFPFSNWSDIISPGGGAELAFSGNQGDAAIDKDSGDYRTTFWGFPLEAVPSAGDREDLLQTVLDWCGGLGPDCPEDVNDDGAVDILDLLAVLAAWGPCAQCAEDVNDDGVVDVLDLLAVLGAWGPCP